MLNYKIIDNYKDFEKVEQLRRKIFNLDMNNDNYYMQQYKDKKLLVISGYLDDELISGCYISNSLSSLYIDQIFVSEKYQKEKYGTLLLNYVLDNKDIFEDFFSTLVNYSRLEPNSKEIETFYKEIGYKKDNNLLDTMSKKI